MKSIVFAFFLTILWVSKPQSQAVDIMGRKNRISFRAGHLVGYMNTEKFPLAINYERLLTNNFSLGGSVGHMLIPVDDFNGYHLAQVTARQFFFGDFQRMAISAHAYCRYYGRFYPDLHLASAIELGYFWQWKDLFLSLEGGLGPGLIREWNSNKFQFHSNIADATLNFGTLF